MLAEVDLCRWGSSRSTGSAGLRSAPAMAAIFFAMVSESSVWGAMLIVGVTLGVLGTIAYIRTGLGSLQPRSQNPEVRLRLWTDL